MIGESLWTRRMRIVVTGGSIDYVSDGRGGFKLRDRTGMTKYLEAMDLNVPWIISEVCLKDSGDLTEDDRHAIMQAIHVTDAECVVVTHGLDTILETADFIRKHVESCKTCEKKSIVLVGTQGPLMGVGFSVAGAAFGAAIATAQAMFSGIYICNEQGPVKIFPNDVA